MRRIVFAFTVSLILAGCGIRGANLGSASPPKIAGVPAPAARPPQQALRRPTRVLPPLAAPIAAASGLEGVLGLTGPDLLRQFGPARVDMREGDVRKLQFQGYVCVLDIWLYPQDKGGSPRAAYFEARRISDGAAVDRLTCITALRPR